MVRLKAMFSSSMAVFRAYFNSNMVRLKGVSFLRIRHTLNDFNSNMVRLKENSDYVSSALAPEFQFQYGSIKRTLFSFLNTTYIAISIPIWFD